MSARAHNREPCRDAVDLVDLELGHAQGSFSTLLPISTRRNIIAFSLEKRLGIYDGANEYIGDLDPSYIPDNTRSLKDRHTKFFADLDIK